MYVGIFYIFLKFSKVLWLNLNNTFTTYLVLLYFTLYLISILMGSYVTASAIKLLYNNQERQSYFLLIKRLAITSKIKLDGFCSGFSCQRPSLYIPK